MPPAFNDTAEVALDTIKKPKGQQQQQRKGFKSAKQQLPEGLIVHDLTEIKPSSRALRSIVATSGRDAAIRDCRAKVEKISRECRLDNVKYRDPHFDLYEMESFCLDGLRQSGEGIAGVAKPASVKRVEDIYDNPAFITDGIDASDIRQGSAGDCWFLAALATIANMPNLLESICVARDEQVGVYGFIFFRDGEWISEVIDDQLYLTHGPYVDADAATKKAFASAAQYESVKLRGSSALHFAKCADSNETWLPLMEKAFAKAHGDYTAIEAGFTGEGVEDLTGGVTSELMVTDILDRDRFWRDELLQVNKELLFAGSINGVEAPVVNGIVTGHAYSVLQAIEANGQRLVQLRNPWGQTEWDGAWSDGSPEWTAEWMTLLSHQFGDDGSFWMTYADFLKTFSMINRTRIFTPEWTVAQRWTVDTAAWPATFSAQEFTFSLAQRSPVVLVLQQVDNRYFVGLDGLYDFQLHFRVRRAGERNYHARSKQTLGMSRSANKELTLDAGTWVVSYKISRRLSGRKSRNAYIAGFSKDQSQKFMHIARSYDYAMARGLLAEDEPEEEEEEADEGDEDDEEPEEEEQEDGDVAEEEAGAEAEKEDEDPNEVDTHVVLGLRVYAKDSNLKVRLVVADDVDQELDPDDSCVHSYLNNASDKTLFLSTSLGSISLN